MKSLEPLLNLQHLCVNEKANDSSVESTKKTESFTTPLSLDEVEVILGYEFKNKQLLEEAFTDASLGEDFSNERLEYVGDSVLNLLFTKDQYFEYPDLSPGVLTRLRAANVDSDKLARVAVKHGFHRFLRHKKPLLEDQIRQFSEEIRRYPLHSNGLVDVPKALADLVESIIGAVFIDSNSSIDIVWKSTTFDVFVDDQFVGRGSCRLKKEIAHNRAAKDALDNIVRILDKKDT
ncbi:hypothetical protein GOBAR_DD03231 [Gossypium barbadense]|nr:hypothetical protein GOBAR_DD03231 [Gossypium barbadense]